MATVEKRVCDIYGTSKDVEHIRIKTEVRMEDTGEWAERWPTVERDLGTRGRKRLYGFMTKGTTKPLNGPVAEVFGSKPNAGDGD